MKRIKLLILALMACLFAVLLCSCVNESYTVKIKNDGGIIKREITMTKEVFDALVSKGASSDDLTDEDVSVEYYKENGVEHARVEYKEKYKTTKELERALSKIEIQKEKQDNKPTYLFDKFSLVKTEEDITIKAKLNPDFEDKIYTSYKISFVFPSDIIENSIGEITDTDTVEIDLVELSHQKQQSFMVRGETSNTYMVWVIVFGIVGIVGVIAIGILLMIRMRKQDEKEEEELEKNDEYGKWSHIGTTFQ